MPHHFFVCSLYDGDLILRVGQTQFMVNLQKAQQLAYYAINKLSPAALSNCHRSAVPADVVQKRTCTLYCGSITYRIQFYKSGEAIYDHQYITVIS